MSRPHQHITPRGLLLHLAGPVQSWGEHSRFNDRDTARFPTRSGVIGLLACALGRKRGEPITDLARLSLTVRADRPGVLLRDLHTVGGGLPPKATVTTAEGKKRTATTATLLTHRYYLADAAFTIAVTGDDTDLIRECAHALHHPAWPLYLGRRSCPPEGPLLLTRGTTAEPLHHLVCLPLARPAPVPSPDKGADEAPKPVQVTFYGDQPLDRLPTAGVEILAQSVLADPDPHGGGEPVGEVNDDPLDIAPRHRVYRGRPLYRRTIAMPGTQCGGLGAQYLDSLRTYLCEHRFADDLRQETA